VARPLRTGGGAGRDPGPDALLLISFGATTDAYGIVTALVGLYPVIVALLGVVFLGERLTRVQATGATLAMAGVLLVSF
jgi:drug/metabolite transporter (DMT)-like permease